MYAAELVCMQRLVYVVVGMVKEKGGVPGPPLTPILLVSTWTG
jgi:hypothetical protein